MYRWVSSPDIRRNLGLRNEPTLQRTQEWIDCARSDPTIHALAIVRAGVHIGNVVLDQIDSRLRSTRLSIYIGEAEFRGCGLGQAALRAAVGLAFKELKLNKVWLQVHCRNASAIRAYFNVGFSIEGVLRAHFLMDEEVVDCFQMSILHFDFFSRKLEDKNT